VLPFGSIRFRRSALWRYGAGQNPPGHGTDAVYDDWNE
jgi:hypothetical protein